MIRKLTNEDRKEVLTYLYQDPSLNIFIIGDIEAFGFNQDFQSIYAEFNEDNAYISVLLFYRENAVFYSHIDHFNADWLNIIKEHKFLYFSGRKVLLKQIYPYLPEFDYKEMYFSEAKNVKHIPSENSLKIKKLETQEEASKLYTLLSSIDEFTVNSQKRDYFIESKMKSLQMGVTYFIEENDIIISSVAATANTTINAMVIGVATLPSARNRGIASKLMIHLMNEYTAHNKYLCLFYDNPKAGDIYKRLGFKDTEKWVMLNKR